MSLALPELKIQNKRRVFLDLPNDMITNIAMFVDIDDMILSGYWMLNKRIFNVVKSFNPYWFQVSANEMTNDLLRSYSSLERDKLKEQRAILLETFTYKSDLEWRKSALVLVNRRIVETKKMLENVFNPLSNTVTSLYTERRGVGKDSVCAERLVEWKDLLHRMGLGMRKFIEISNCQDPNFKFTFDIPWTGGDSRRYEGSYDLENEKVANILTCHPSFDSNTYESVRIVDTKTSMEIFDNCIKSDEAYQQLIGFLKRSVSVKLESKDAIKRIIKRNKEEMMETLKIVADPKSGKGIGIHDPLSSSLDKLMDEYNIHDHLSRTPTIHRVLVMTENKLKKHFSSNKSSKIISKNITERSNELDKLILKKKESNNEEMRNKLDIEITDQNKKINELQQIRDELNRRKNKFITNSGKVKKYREKLKDKKEEMESLINKKEGDLNNNSSNSSEIKKIKKEFTKNKTRINNQLQSLQKRLAYYSSEKNSKVSYWDERVSEKVFLRRPLDLFSSQFSNDDSDKEEEEEEEKKKIVMNDDDDFVLPEDQLKDEEEEEEEEEEIITKWDGDYNDPLVPVLEMGVLVSRKDDGHPVSKGFGTGLISNENISLVQLCNSSNPDSLQSHEIVSLVQCKEGKDEFIGSSAEMKPISDDTDDFFEYHTKKRVFVKWETLMMKLNRDEDVSLLEYLLEEKSTERNQGKLIQKGELSVIKKKKGMFVDISYFGTYISDWKMLCLRYNNLGDHFSPYSTREKSERKAEDMSDDSFTCREIFDNTVEFSREGLLRSSGNIAYMKSISLLCTDTDMRLHGKTAHIRKFVHQLVIILKKLRLGKLVMSILRRWGLYTAKSDTVDTKNFSFGHSKSRQFLKNEEKILKLLFEGSGGVIEKLQSWKKRKKSIITKQEKKVLPSRITELEKIQRKIFLGELLVQMKRELWEGLKFMFGYFDRERNLRKSSTWKSHEPRCIEKEYLSFEDLNDILVPKLTEMQMIQRKVVQETGVCAYYDSYLYREYIVMKSKLLTNKNNQCTAEMVNMMVNSGYRRSSKWGGREGKVLRQLEVSSKPGKFHPVTRKIDSMIGVMSRFRRMKKKKVKNEKKYIY